MRATVFRSTARTSSRPSMRASDPTPISISRRLAARSRVEADGAECPRLARLPRCLPRQSVRDQSRPKPLVTTRPRPRPDREGRRHDDRLLDPARLLMSRSTAKVATAPSPTLFSSHRSARNDDQRSDGGGAARTCSPRPAASRCPGRIPLSPGNSISSRASPSRPPSNRPRPPLRSRPFARRSSGYRRAKATCSKAQQEQLEILKQKLR